MIYPAMAAVRRGASLAASQPRTTAWTLIALASALFMVGLAGIAAMTIDGWASSHPGSGGAMVVYLDESVAQPRAEQLVAQLRGLRGVERATWVSAEASARKLSRALGSDAALLDGVDVASLPASVEVVLAPGMRDVVAMSRTLRALRAAPGVTDVVVEDAGDDQLAAVLQTARGVAWTGAGVFTALALVIVLAAVRVRLASSPREQAVLALLGAPPSFLIVPSALAGMLHGAVAAIAAALALGGVLQGRFGALAAIDIAAPPLTAIAALIGLGALVGFVGGGLAGVARAR